MNDTVLRTGRLLLRPIGPRDACWDVVSMLAMPPWPYTREHAEAYAARARFLETASMRPASPMK